jgi:hypothetical protein
MSILTPSQATSILRNLGFRIRNASDYRQAVRDFQIGWNLGNALADHGLVGARTSNALRLSESRRRQGKGTLSANFSYVEFRCKCGGRFTTCRRIFIIRVQIQRLEAYRRRVGHPVTVVSGYRCPGHNNSVGGATHSQHMVGTACDVPGVLTRAQVRALGTFTGIGYSSSTGRVLHVDSRSGNVNSPAEWRYA